MLLTLVLAACVTRAACEWVEISQQHYRKPVRTHAHSGNFYPASDETIDDEAAFHLNDDMRKPSDTVSHTFHPNDDHGRPDGDEVTHIFDLNDERRKPNDNMFHTFPIHDKKRKGAIMSHTFHPNDERRKPGDDMPNIFHSNDAKRRPGDEITHTFHPNDERIKPYDDGTHTFTPNKGNNRPYGNVHDPTQIKQDHTGKIKRTHSNRIYLNQSVPEHNSNVELGDINLDRDFKKKPNIKPTINTEYGEEIDIEPEDITSSYSNKMKDKEVFSATIERVGNKGSVKRVQLSDTPVKSPSITDRMSPIRKNVIKPHGSTITDDDFSDESEIKLDMFKNEQKDNVTPKNQVNNFFSDVERTTMWKYDKIPTSTSEPTMIIQRNPQTHKFSDIKRTENKVSKADNISNVEEYGVSADEININAVNNEDYKNKEESIKNKIPNIVTKDEKTDKLEYLDSEESTATISPINNNFNGPKAKPNNKRNPNDENDKNEEIKVNTMENIMKFVKVVADTISKNTNRGVNGKVKYLNELKETLLSSIRSHIEATWPDEASGGTRRRSRSARGRGHVEFPSSESSLMTISFLTFAVFLIKLVLQVIQTYKNKAMMVAPLVVATAGRTLPKLR